MTAGVPIGRPWLKWAVGWRSFALVQDRCPLRPKRPIFGFDAPEHVDDMLSDIAQIDLYFNEVSAQHARTLAPRSGLCLPNGGEIHLPLDARRGRGQIWSPILVAWRRRVGKVRHCAPPETGLNGCNLRQP